MFNQKQLIENDLLNYAIDSGFPAYLSVTYEDIATWLRECHEIHVNAKWYKYRGLENDKIILPKGDYVFRIEFMFETRDGRVGETSSKRYDTYESAIRDGLFRAIECIGVYNNYI